MVLKNLRLQLTQFISKRTSGKCIVYCQDINLGLTDSRKWLRYDKPTFQRLKFARRSAEARSGSVPWVA